MQDSLHSTVTTTLIKAVYLSPQSSGDVQLPASPVDAGDVRFRPPALQVSLQMLICCGLRMSSVLRKTTRMGNMSISSRTLFSLFTGLSFIPSYPFPAQGQRQEVGTGSGADATLGDMSARRLSVCPQCVSPMPKSAKCR